jgi:pimeloyl-ACP methyl ester carboxylesterase
MKKSSVIGCIILIGCLAACRTPEVEPTAVQPTATPSDISGVIDIGPYGLFLECQGSGTPVVILEAGWGDTSETWELVMPEVARHTRVCAYDRVGLGSSDPGPEPETYLEAVEDLHKLLVEAEVKGPYILVGHSLGGMYIRLFQAEYPEEVAGLVLVDSSHPESFERSLAVLPPKTEGENEHITYYRNWFSSVEKDPTLTPELLQPGSLGSLPLTVLTGTNKVREGLPFEINSQFNQIWVNLQTELALMSTDSTHTISDQSGHFIQHDQPELVIEAIVAILEQVED